MKIRSKFTQNILVYTTLFVAMLFFSYQPIYAFSDVSVFGASKIPPRYQIYIDGILVDKPEDTISIGSNQPTFFGYTFSNVKIALFFDNQHAAKYTTTDNTGYWVYSLKQKLPLGTHTLHVKTTDFRGSSTPTYLAAAFRIPAVLGSSTRKIIVPAPSLNKLDYLTVSLLIFGTTAFLICIYIVAKQHAIET